MRNMSYTEKKMLITKHLKEGYTLQEARSIVNMECDKLREQSKQTNKENRDKKKDFKTHFAEMTKSE